MANQEWCSSFETQSAVLSATCCGFFPGRAWETVHPSRSSSEAASAGRYLRVFPTQSHSQDSLRFVDSHLCVKHLCFVMVVVSDSYLSAAEDLAVSKVKLSEAFCAPALGT